MVDFFELMNTGNIKYYNIGNYVVDYVLTHYPIMNEIFTNFFRTVVILASVCT